MIYYPLQLLQLAGITRRPSRHREGTRRADDRPARRRPARAAGRRRPDPRARSHVQGADRAGRHRAGRGHGARTSPGASRSSWSSATTSSSTRSRRRSESGLTTARARADLREASRRSARTSASSCTTRTAHVVGHRREGGGRGHAIRRAAVAARRRRPLLLPAGRLRRDRDARALGARRARDHRREPSTTRSPAASTPRRSRAGGRTPASTGSTSPTSGVGSSETGVEQAGRCVIDGLRRIPLRRYEDERGWFCELRRDSELPKPMPQTNVSFSRAGVVRGLHYHERGQDDLFACLRGTARVVVLDRATGETFYEDIGDENPVAIYIPGHPRARLRGADRHPLLLPRHRRVRLGRPGRAYDPLERPARRVTYGARAPRSCPRGTPRRVLITGAGGQLGSRAAAGVRRRRRRGARRAPTGTSRIRPTLLAGRSRPRAARGSLDRRRRRRGRPAGRGRRERRGTCERRRARGAARRRSPPTTCSTAASARRTSSRTGRTRSPRTAARSSTARRPPATPGSCGRPGSSARPGTTSSGRCSGSPRSATRSRSSTTSADARRSSAISPRPSGSSWTTSCREGLGTSPPTGTARGRNSPRRSSRRPGSTAPCGGSRPTELERPAPRPAYAVLRSERPGAPALPHWRDGLRACLAEMGG